jgi:glycosyltransferase involved in cell wall biosynthesis
MQLSVEGINISTYTDILKLPTNKAKEKGFRAFAEYLYEQQPSFMKRGAERFNCLISYDAEKNCILWDGEPIPGSQRLHSNCKPGEHFGKVVLVLMVKNESAIIERALNSVMDQIDGFIILDTGSIDDTVSKMWNLLCKHNKKGEIYSAKFYDFASNRTIVTQLAHQRGDWLVLYDADYVLAMPDALKERFHMKEQKDWVGKLPPKSQGVRSLLLNTSGQLQYSRPHIVDGSCRWSYYCRTHEYLGRSKFCPMPEASPQANFEYIQIDHIGDGGCKSDKAPRDIVLLLMDLFDNPKSERAFFYLGNSLMGAELYEWAIRCYKSAMNYCGWYEEMYISSKEMAQCFRFLEYPWERRIGILLHGMFQNPNRLEMLTHFIRDLRHGENKEIREEYSHLVCSIAACFTHNQFPSEQKLFIDRYDHELAFWLELALLAQEVPVYFSLGCYAVKRAKESNYYKELDAKQSIQLKDSVQLVYEFYQEVLKDWDKTRVFKTPQIANYVLQQAHARYAERDYSVAKLLYTEYMQPTISKSLLPKHLLEAETEQTDAKFKVGILNQLETEQHHKWNPLTSWRSAISVYSPALQNKMRKSDETEAVACYQLALCQQEMAPKYKFATIAYLMDSLKMLPTFTPATTLLYDLTHMAKSHFTRAALYCLRIATHGRIRLQSMHTYAIVQNDINTACLGFLDTSAFCSLKQSAGCLTMEPRIRYVKPRVVFAPLESLFTVRV